MANTPPRPDLKTPSVRKAFIAYVRSCYGDEKLPDTQFAEVEQAFMAGLMWLMGIQGEFDNPLAAQQFMIALDDEVQRYKIARVHLLAQAAANPGGDILQ